MKDFVGCHNLRDYDTMEQISEIARSMAGKRLRYADLTGLTKAD